MLKSDKTETFDVLFILFDVLIFVVVINYFCSSDLCQFRCSDVVVVMNLKDNFDVLKEMASCSSEIRRSDPLPVSLGTFLTGNLVNSRVSISFRRQDGIDI